MRNKKYFCTFCMKVSNEKPNFNEINDPELEFLLVQLFERTIGLYDFIRIYIYYFYCIITTLLHNCCSNEIYFLRFQSNICNHYSNSLKILTAVEIFLNYNGEMLNNKNK